MADLMDLNFDHEIQQITPQEYFNDFQSDTKNSLPETIKKVVEFLDNKKKLLQSFDWDLISFKYIVEKSETTDFTEKEGLPVPGILSTVAIIVVLKDTTISDSDKENSKLGLMVFTIKDSEVFTDDNIKGEDGKIYAFTDLGLASYFSDLRSSVVNM